MRRLLFALATLIALTGCGASPLTVATKTANATKIATLSAHEILDTECVAKVPKAKTAEDLAALQYVCDPIADGYRTARLAHAVLVAAIAAGESTDPALLVTRTFEAAQAAAKLADALDRARKSR